MTSLDALSANAPPLVVLPPAAPAPAPVAPAPANTNDAPDNDSENPAPTPVAAAPTNANENTPAAYTALATESQSNIRGAGLDISA